MAETLKIVREVGNQVKEQPAVYFGVAVSEGDLKDMMSESVSLAQQKMSGLKVTPQLNVAIRGDKCLINGQVGVDFPGFGHSTVTVESLRLGNDQTPGLLKVEESRITKNLDFRVGIAAAAAGVDIDAEVRRVLQNPYAAIRGVLGTELQKEGVQLLQMGLQLSEGSLLMGISGQPIKK